MLTPPDAACCTEYKLWVTPASASVSAVPTLATEVLRFWMLAFVFAYIVLFLLLCVYRSFLDPMLVDMRVMV